MQKYAQELEEAERLVNFYEQEETNCENDIKREKSSFHRLRVRKELLELRLYVYFLLEKISAQDKYQNLIRQTKHELQENREHMKRFFQKQDLLKTYPNKKQMAISLVKTLQKDQSKSVPIKQYQKR